MPSLMHIGSDDVIIDLAATCREEVLAELASLLSARHPELSPDRLLHLLLERESMGSTGIGDGIAIPHCKVPGIEIPLFAIGRSSEGIEFNAIDGQLVNLFFLVVAPEGDAGLHLKLLARISRLLKDAAVRSRIIAAASAAEMAAIVTEQEGRP
jgi:mannitol/fructose-specific phosphotransferase system IIA component (Ntr-type)